MREQIKAREPKSTCFEASETNWMIIRNQSCGPMHKRNADIENETVGILDNYLRYFEIGQFRGLEEPST